MNAEQLRRFVLAKVHGKSVMELCIDRGAVQPEPVSEWTAEQVDAAIKAAADSDDESQTAEQRESIVAPEVDLITEIMSEAQVHADAAREPVKFLLRWLNIHKKAKKVYPFVVEPAVKRAATFSENGALQALLDAVLKSNQQMVAAHDSIAKAAERILGVANTTLEIVKKQQLEPSPVQESRELLPEEVEAIRARTALVQAAASNIETVVDTIAAVVVKVLKLDPADAALVNGAAAAAKLGGKVLAAATTEGTPQ